MDYQTAVNKLKTNIVPSFAKTKFSRYRLRKKSILWAINLPKGEDYSNRVETSFYETYRGSIIKFGKPGKESKRKEPNPWDMKPTLYEMRDDSLALSEKRFEFFGIHTEVNKKINENRKAGQALLALIYRAGVLLDHSYTNGTFSYDPPTEVIEWLDLELKEAGEIPPSELVPMFDAIMLNEDVKVYLNTEKYQTKKIEPRGARGRINTMGNLFAACASKEVLPRLELAALLIRGRGTARIFTNKFDNGAEIISPLTGGIVYSLRNKELSEYK